MSVIVDTPVWSEFVRRQTPNELVSLTLRTLILAGDAILIGAIRQEILSGIRDQKQFTQISDSLRGFPNPPIETADYVMAAMYFNECRSAGIQGSNTDFLICAVAVRLDAEILTLDKDFEHFAKILPIQIASLKSEV